VEDSQCGLRVYPLELVEAVHCRAGHFSFETEIITRAGWAGFDVVGVPVSCIYLPPGQRVSHLKPVRETIRASWMHLKLMARALTPWPLRHGGARKGIGDAFSEAIGWLSPLRAWREIRTGGTARIDYATGFAVGVFIANLPVYGVQTLLSLYVARRLHLHPLAVVAGSQVSSPPVGPVLIAAAIALGHVLLHGSLPELSRYDPRNAGAIIGSVLLEWTVGAVAIGAVLAAMAFALVNLVCRAVGPASSPTSAET
jgi:uncharacterized protein (DUF2062 family)